MGQRSAAGCWPRAPGESSPGRWFSVLGAAPSSVVFVGEAGHWRVGGFSQMLLMCHRSGEGAWAPRRQKCWITQEGCVRSRAAWLDCRVPACGVGHSASVWEGAGVVVGEHRVTSGGAGVGRGAPPALSLQGLCPEAASALVPHPHGCSIFANVRAIPT